MSKYTDLITNYHAGKQKYVEHVDLSTRPLIDVSASIAKLVAAFDVDTAIGTQLDILGKWIGVAQWRRLYQASSLSGIKSESDGIKVYGWGPISLQTN